MVLEYGGENAMLQMVENQSTSETDLEDGVLKQIAAGNMFGFNDGDDELSEGQESMAPSVRQRAYHKRKGLAEHQFLEVKDGDKKPSRR